MKKSIQKVNQFTIKNAVLIDGTGSAPREANIFVQDGIITRISQEKISNQSGPGYDAGGLVLAPGFIDSHGHSDISAIAAPEMEGKISQGITLEICGNCGLSTFPVTDKNREHLNEIYKHYNVKIDWTDVEGYAKKINYVTPSINIASLCGHNTLRAAICGYDKKKISPEELKLMKKLLRSSLSGGTIGFSTGLLYVPGIFSDSAEILSLLRELANFAKIYTTHLRNEGDKLEEAVAEAINLTKKSSCKHLHISHLKTAGKSNWKKLDSVFEMIQDNSQFIKITADRYPYVESLTTLSAYLPPFFREMDDIKIETYLADKKNWKIASEILSKLPREFWESMRLVDSSIETYKKHLGEKFSAISKRTKKSLVQICLELLTDAPSAAAACSGMSEENMKRILLHPLISCGSDESSKNRGYDLGRSHPRGFGSFPKFINIVSEKLNLAETVRKITSLPASIFGLKKRGKIKEGFYADLVLFDSAKLKDRANFAKPHLLSEGIEKVWVNGVLSWSDGSHTGQRGGRFIK
jgi:N-acyl-D-amino-acid deacylase